MFLGMQHIDRFDVVEPQQWFDSFEATLRINRTSTEDYYDYLLSLLHREARAPISLSMQSPPEDESKRYEWLKALLIEGHSKSSRDKLRQLLQGEKIGDRKPSHFLAHLNDLAPQNMDRDLLKEIWWKELSSTTRAILSPIEDQEITKIAAAADAIHAEMGNAHIHAVRPAATSSDRQILDDICKVLSDLQRSVRELVDQSARNQERGRPRDSNRYRPRSQSNSRQLPENHDAQGVCPYHQTYGRRSFRCTPPCTYPKN